MIDKDDERKIFRVSSGRAIDVRHFIFDAAMNRSDRIIARQKLARHVNRLIEQPAWIAAQVEHDLIHALRLELADGLAQLVAGGMLKTAGQTDVARAGTNHVGVAQRRQGNRFAHYREGEWSFLACALDTD